MGRRREEDDPDRFLQLRGGRWHYCRRIPKEVADLDERRRFVRRALGTSDKTKARTARDLYEQADNSLWASFLLGDSAEAARARYRLAVRRAESLGFVYRPLAEILSRESDAEILGRVETIVAHGSVRQDVQALAGTVDVPDDLLSEALQLWFKEIARDELRRKSPDQKKRWKAKRKYAIDVFIEVVSDKPMSSITRDDARLLHKHWLDKIAPEKGTPTHTASTGNRNVGYLRKLYDAYFRRIGFPEQKNPFADLSFSDRSQRTRPPFSVEWIRDVLFKKGTLDALNDEARAIVLVMAETGARPSEIANLNAATIKLDDSIPHIMVQPSDDPDDPREIKTASSVRRIPLVGVALAAMRKHPAGFPRYKDKSATLSATVNKHFRSAKVLPTPAHKLYSLRHSFEDRMKNAKFDEELRRMLMGHTIERPRYGEGGAMEMWRDEMLRIALPFDAGIV